VKEEASDEPTHGIDLDLRRNGFCWLVVIIHESRGAATVLFNHRLSRGLFASRIRWIQDHHG
jgi:hypothetical protein